MTQTLPTEMANLSQPQIAALQSGPQQQVSICTADPSQIQFHQYVKQHKMKQQLPPNAMINIDGQTIIHGEMLSETPDGRPGFEPNGLMQGIPKTYQNHYANFQGGKQLDPNIYKIKSSQNIRLDDDIARERGQQYQQ